MKIILNFDGKEALAFAAVKYLPISEAMHFKAMLEAGIQDLFDEFGLPIPDKVDLDTGM